MLMVIVMMLMKLMRLIDMMLIVVMCSLWNGFRSRFGLLNSLGSDFDLRSYYQLQDGKIVMKLEILNY